MLLKKGIVSLSGESYLDETCVLKLFECEKGLCLWIWLRVSIKEVLMILKGPECLLTSFILKCFEKGFKYSLNSELLQDKQFWTVETL